jgi:peptidoglycan hydrolase CwlO-like protein
VERFIEEVREIELTVSAAKSTFSRSMPSASRSKPRSNLAQVSRLCLAIVISQVGISCGDDPKLVEQRDRQHSEISQLKKELGVITERLKNIPPDVTRELAEARSLDEKQSAEVAALESEIAVLEADHSSQQKKFESYQMKYRLK